MADQQHQYLLWGTGSVLGLPTLVHRPIWLYGHVHHPLTQTGKTKMPNVTAGYQRLLGRARHEHGTLPPSTATHTHRVGGRAAALGRLKPVPTLALVSQNFTQFCKCSWRRRLPVPPQKEKNKTKQNFDSNKTNVDIFAYIPFCNKYLQVSLCEQTPRHNHM